MGVTEWHCKGIASGKNWPTWSWRRKSPKFQILTLIWWTWGVFTVGYFSSQISHWCRMCGCLQRTNNTEYYKYMHTDSTINRLKVTELIIWHFFLILYRLYNIVHFLGCLFILSLYIILHCLENRTRPIPTTSHNDQINVGGTWTCIHPHESPTPPLCYGRLY